jgi:2,5-diamino-6-(ribosylamino)-4(3H)-pyrimidinone 5'-phosphate reductase
VKPSARKRGRPFLFINMAISADGKIATTNRAVSSFGSKRDQEHLLELRAQADAVMAGARTVDLNPVSLGPGPAKYRRARLRNGLAEYNLRIVVSGSGSIDSKAPIFQKRFSPIIVLTTARISADRLNRLRKLADEVKICGRKEINWLSTLRWLQEKWKVRRLLCEGGGELNGALFQVGVVDEIHLTLCPVLVGGRDAPTIADGGRVQRLSDAHGFKLISAKRIGTEMFLVYRR